MSIEDVLAWSIAIPIAALGAYATLAIGLAAWDYSIQWWNE